VSDPTVLGLAWPPDLRVVGMTSSQTQGSWVWLDNQIQET